MTRRSTRPHRTGGFTLIEMVMVIVLTGIIGGVVAVFIRSPVEGYVDLARRAELTDQAESALRLMMRDIRRALPNSLRCNNGCVGATAIEMINTTDGGRYRAVGAAAADVLDFAATDAAFNIIGTLQNTAPASPVAGIRLAVNSMTTAGGPTDPYAGTVLTPVATEVNIPAAVAGEHAVTLTAGGAPAPHLFPMGVSGMQRVFLVDGPIAYVCENGVINRYAGHALTPVAAWPPAGVGTPVTGQVTACSFNYSAGTATRAALITLEITLSDGEETVRLLQQVHVDNAS